MGGHESGSRPGPGPGLVANVAVGAQTVPRATRRAADAALALAARLLPFLPRPPALTVRWFKEAEGVVEHGDASLAMLGRVLGVTGEHDPRFAAFLSQHHVNGIAYGPDEGTIWLRATLAPREAAWTTLHECRHRAQFYADRHRPDGAPPRELTKDRRAAMEADAEAFADAHIAQVEVEREARW